MLHNTLEQDMLLEALEKDCRHWISTYRQIFMNECDMQLKLANYLAARQDHYDRVHVEYAVPLKSLADVSSASFVLEKLGISEMEDIENEEEAENMENAEETKKSKDPLDANVYIDIVVEKDGKFATVELKYATALIEEQLPVFEKDRKGITKYDVIKNTGGQNNKRYDYWYDVCRIEALTRFQNVAGGIALMVTNDSIYWTTPKDNEKPDYAAFSMREAKTMEPGKLDWKRKNTTTSKKTRHAFHLDGSYYCHWEKTQIPALARDKTVRKDKDKNERSFRYMMSVIPPKSIKQQIQESKEEQ